MFAIEFQFTHPGRGATTVSVSSDLIHSVSIHAPREGCDSRDPMLVVLSAGFNSRTPGGVRLVTGSTIKLVRLVSIHAPREGCDLRVSALAGFLTMFQFTHPGRGATILAKSPLMLRPCFNSRTPGGVRQSTALANSHLYVSIHAPREGCDLATCVSKIIFRSFNSRTPGGVRRPTRLTNR